MIPRSTLSIYRHGLWWDSEAELSDAELAEDLARDAEYDRNMFGPRPERPLPNENGDDGVE